MQSRMSFADLHAAAAGRWPEILVALGVPAEALRNRHGPCPGCGGVDRFRFDDRGAGRFICSRGGGEPLSGDGFELLQHVHDWSASRALREVAELLVSRGNSGGKTVPTLGGEQRQTNSGASCTTIPKKRTTLAPAALAEWAGARFITPDDPAGRYLIGRGCVLPPSDGDLRWVDEARHKSGHVGPALVALLTEPITAAPVTVQLTWIKPDGSGKADLDPPRLHLAGHTNRGVVRLWPDEAVTGGLGLAEGVESALTVAKGFSPIWATTVANNIAEFPVLAGVESLTVFADSDKAGLKAAEACCTRWHAAGREVKLWQPPRAGLDPNDVWGRA